MSESTSHPVPQPSASCPECGGDCVPVGVEVFGGGWVPGELYLQRPGVSWSGGTSTLRALVCCHCGLTRFYAEKPTELLPKK